MEKDKNPWSVVVALDDIPETGLHTEMEAPEPVRADLAKLAGLRELPRLSAVFDLTPRGGGVHVSRPGERAPRPDLRCHARADRK